VQEEGEMKKIIYKYELDLVRPTILVPPGSEVLSVGVKKGRVFVWVLVTAGTVNTEKINFNVYSTGFEIPMNENMGNFLGTILLCEDELVGLVYHIFERTE